MATTLVTGGAGYLGSVLVPALVEAGRAVVVVDPLLYGQSVPTWAGHQQVSFLLRGIEALDVEDLRGVDEVIDLAAVSNELVAETFSDLAWATNDAGRRRVATLSRKAGVQRYILASSSNVYGSREEPYTEYDAIRPASTYSRANAAAERGVLALASDSFHPVVLRQATVYGFAPCMRYDLVINAMAADACLAGECRVMGDGTQIRPFIWVQSLVEVYLTLLRRSPRETAGKIFNAGSTADQYVISEIPEMLGSLLRKTVPFSYYGEMDRLSHRLNYVALEGITARPIGPDFDRGAGELLARIVHDPAHVMKARSERHNFVAMINGRLPNSAL